MSKWCINNLFLDDNRIFVAMVKHGAEAPSGTVFNSIPSTEKFQKNIPHSESILDRTRNILANFQNNEHVKRENKTIKL